MVQSWFADAATIADHINSAAKNTRDKDTLTVKLYMLDPELDIGAQRHAEVDGSLPNYDLDVQRRKFQEEFEVSKRRFINRLQRNSRIDLQIFTYHTLPTLICYIIDDKEFIFGWLGTDGPSTQNVGFHLSSGSGDAEKELAIEKIRNHYVALDKHSKQVWPAIEG